MPASLKKIPVVYYHSIGPILPEWNRNFLTTEVDCFEKHLVHFKKKYDIISLQDYYAIRKGSMNSPKNPLVITIDDGFLDNWIWAFPLLKKHSVKATIFVSPEMIDKSDAVRPTSEDLSKGKVTLKEISTNGYMSWQELRLMMNSGFVDIQSHTMSHTKYFVSDKIVGFHHKGDDCLYPVGNIFLERKPNHITDPGFEKLLPYGTPFFEERSSVMARKVTINPEFELTCVNALKGFSEYNFHEAMTKVRPVYEDFQRRNLVIVKKETEEEYKARLIYEIIESKKIIESKLNTKVEFLCWPHGDNNEEAHNVAIAGGYKATTTGKQKEALTLDRIGPRWGCRPYLGSVKLGLWKFDAKVNEMNGKSSAKYLRTVFRVIKSFKK